MQTQEAYIKIAELGKQLVGELNASEVLATIAEEAKKILGVERCSIFVVDTESNMLWTEHSDGIGRIAIGMDSGIAGSTYQSQEPQMVNAPYDDTRFLHKIDEKSGFTTRNVLTAPIFSSKREVIGVLQLLNKAEGEFHQGDLDVLTFFANFVSGNLELALMK